MNEKIEIKLTNGKLIPSIITNEELVYGVTAIAVGMKNDYIDNSSNVGRIENIFAKHPLTNENLPIIYVFNTQNNRFLDDIYLFTLSPKSVIIKYEDLTEENLEKIIGNEKKFFLICNEGVEKEKFKNLYTKLEYLQKLNAAEIYKIEV